MLKNIKEYSNNISTFQQMLQNDKLIFTFLRKFWVSTQDSNLIIFKGLNSQIKVLKYG